MPTPELPSPLFGPRNRAAVACPFNKWERGRRRLVPAPALQPQKVLLASRPRQLGRTSHSLGSMWPRFSTTLNVPFSDRAMYMFMRTWCWPGTISAGPPGPCGMRAWSRGGDDVVLLERAGLVHRGLPHFQRPVGAGARRAGREHRAPRVPGLVPVQEFHAERVLHVPVVVEASINPLDVLGRHEVQEVLVESKDPQGAAEAMSNAAARGPTIRSDLELRLLRATTAMLQGSRQAHQLVREVLAISDRHGFVQTVLDTAPQLVDHLIADAASYPSTDNLSALIAAGLHARKLAPSRPHNPGLPDPLTDAELGVLEKLPQRLTYVDMASDLHLSLNTVKTHLRHTYMKLGVTSRSSAVKRAASRGLL